MLKWLSSDFVFLLSILLAVTISLRRPYDSHIFSIFLLCMESNALVKSMTNSVTSVFFARTPLLFRWIVRICEVVQPFLWKLSWFFPRICSISGQIRLRSWTSWTLAASNHISLYFQVIPRSLFLGKQERAKFCPFLYRFLFILLKVILW